MPAKYSRIVLKISGEALAGKQGYGIDFDVVDMVANEIAEVVELGIQVGLVVGGGNIWRGRLGVGMDRTTADHMGMLATVINSLALQDALEKKDIPTRVQTAIEMRSIAEPYIRRRATRHFEKGRVVIFACGTGNPYFTTDTTAALRAAEMEAEIILLAKNVDGVYDSDPAINADAQKIDKLGYLDVISRDLGIMDHTAITMCKENGIPIIVFALSEKGNIKKAIMGEDVGTIISNGD